jgi:hypothetical protein
MEAITGNTNASLREARAKLAALIEIARWVWVVNAAVTLVGAYYGRYDIAALAGFTWMFTLVATAIGKRVYVSLREEPTVTIRRVGS